MIIINYLDVYINLHLRINRVSESEKKNMTRKITKLQEWSNTSMRKRDEHE